MVFATALVSVLALGITSIPGPEKVFETFERKVLGRERTGVDTNDSNEFVESVNEEEAYQKIEEEFGFVPVKLLYLPEQMEFLEAKIGGAIQGVDITYGNKEKVKIRYSIHPNYRKSSIGKDVEDELKEEYEKKNDYKTKSIKKYLVNKKEERWSVQFEYKNVFYSILIMDTSKEETEKIVENLIFS